jgi:hypothetical protein
MTQTIRRGGSDGVWACAVQKSPPEDRLAAIVEHSAWPPDVTVIRASWPLPELAPQFGVAGVSSRRLIAARCR